MYFLGIFYSFSQSSGQVGINTDTPTETLDVNGKIRIRDVSLASTPRWILLANDSGVINRFSYDSLMSTVSKSAQDVSYVSGDTIHTGDVVAMGDACEWCSNHFSSCSFWSANWVDYNNYLGC
jgi:hypothetical protein